MVVTSRTPLFILLISFVLTALQGCGPDCPAALQESGLPYTDADGKDVEGSEECGFGSDDGTEAPGGRLLEDPYAMPQSKLMGPMHQIYAIQARIGRGLSDGSAMVKEMCETVQKMVDCYGGKDGAMCECTCAATFPEEDDEDDDSCKVPDGDKEEDISEKTWKEIIDMLFIESDIYKEFCKDDNALKNPCGKGD